MKKYHTITTMERYRSGKPAVKRIYSRDMMRSRAALSEYKAQVRENK